MQILRKSCLGFFSISVVTVLLGVMACFIGELPAQGDPPMQAEPVVREGPPIGVYVERLVQEGSDTIDKCKYCGRFVKIGEIHRDAEKVIDSLVSEELDNRNIPHEEGKEQAKYIHVYIFRYEERRGGNLGVEKPASVGYHMHLFDRDIVKRVFVFDEEQRPLLENIFKIGQFIRRGMKWITADKLAEEGIKKGLDTLLDDLK